MKRLMGLETEYGLYIEGVDVSKLTDEARAFVECIPTKAAWDYGDESPLRDVRGFRAATLTTNPKDDEVEQRSGRMRPRHPGEDHVDRVLSNGARLYHDHGHPEYSTPECIDARDLVTHDRAGELLMLEAARAYSEKTGRYAALYKNNTDYHAMSYGHHENYLFQRQMPFEQLVHAFLPFLVTRIIYTGAGKVGTERATSPRNINYQLSQRAEFFDTIMSVDTLHRRPLMNTRDEPHADSQSWRRLHVICGDANLSEFSTALKVGTASLVLDVIELGYGAPIELKDPVRAIRELSCDSEWKWLVESTDGQSISAIEIQRAYWLAASERLQGRDDETDWVLENWGKVLDDLEVDPLKLNDRLDWVIKLDLLNSFLEAEQLDWPKNIDLLRSLELEYHNIDRADGLFWALEESGAVVRLSTDEAIESAIECPPRNTRALLRGLAASRLDLKAANWRRLKLEQNGQLADIDLGPLVNSDIESFSQDIMNLESAQDMINLMNKINNPSGGEIHARAKDTSSE